MGDAQKSVGVQTIGFQWWVIHIHIGASQIYSVYIYTFISYILYAKCSTLYSICYEYYKYYRYYKCYYNYCKY